MNQYKKGRSKAKWDVLGVIRRPNEVPHQSLNNAQICATEDFTL